MIDRQSRGFSTSGRHLRGPPPQQTVQSPHVVGQIHHPDFGRRTQFAFGPNEDSALHGLLRAKHVLHSGSNPRTPFVRGLLRGREFPVALRLVMHAADQILCFQQRFMF